MQGFNESDKPNFTGSYYSHCKAITENLLAAYPKARPHALSQARFAVISAQSVAEVVARERGDCAACPTSCSEWWVL